MSTQEITKITVTDFMGIEGTVELFPSGSLQIIAGPNGSGKSSFIHALEECFDPQGTRLIPKPVNSKASRARVEILLTNARIVREYPKDGPGVLSAYALDGAKYSSAKAFVAEITGGLLFDPDEFVTLPEKDQRERLLGMVTLPFDLTEIDSQRKGLFDARTDVTREVKRLTAARSALVAPPAGTPTEEVSSGAILAELNDAQEVNREYHQLAADTESAGAAEDRAAANVARLTDELDAARVYLTRSKETHAEVSAKSAAARRIDTEPFTARLATVDDTNRLVRAGTAVTRADADLFTKKAEEDALNSRLDIIDATKAAGLAAADFPAGLSIDDVGIVFGGIPFRQVNSAVQDFIALDLATSGNPALKVVVMKSGDRLDDVRLAGVQKLATERGYFVMMERDRGNSRDVGFTVQNGEVSE